MKTYTLREANVEDWEELKNFFLRIYRPNHPCQNFDFWKWQYGNADFGRSILAEDNGKVVGHMGFSFDGGYCWGLNLFLDNEYRGQGIIRNMYDIARQYHPLATTNANANVIGMYRKMRWIRYLDLQRYIIINPGLSIPTIENVLTPIEIKSGLAKPDDGLHYWLQPGIKPAKLSDGSTGVIQENLGGFRFIEIEKVKEATEELWSLGFTWADFLTSENDFTIPKLENAGWLHDSKSIVPWNLNPIMPDSRATVSYHSEEPMPKDFIVKRYYSDHGRVGSLPNE